MSLVLGFLLLASSLVSQEASAFTLPTYIRLTPYQATAEVTNPYSHPIACVVHIEAQRNDGLWQYANVNLGYIPYGYTEYAYIYTGAPFHYVYANGWSDCGYLY
ncbi:MAG: hypothetical protein NDJ90_01900 [Oligoflexia bacterium]|nr:hypothetical protein [Oligoflexia bacterium]